MSNAKNNCQLSSKFGFQDPDRSNERHQLTALYVENNIDVIMRSIYSKDKGKFSPLGIADYAETIFYNCEVCGNSHDVEVDSAIITRISSYGLKPEAVLSKGEGQYKTSIGFIDFVVEVKFEMELFFEKPIYTWTKKKILFKEAKKFRDNTYIKCHGKKIITTIVKQYDPVFIQRVVPRNDDELHEFGVLEDLKVEKNSYDQDCKEAWKRHGYEALNNDVLELVFKNDFGIFVKMMLLDDPERKKIESCLLDAADKSKYAYGSSQSVYFVWDRPSDWEKQLSAKTIDVNKLLQYYHGKVNCHKNKKARTAPTITLTLKRMEYKKMSIGEARQLLKKVNLYRYTSGLSFGPRIPDQYTEKSFNDHMSRDPCDDDEVEVEVGEGGLQTVSEKQDFVRWFPAEVKIGRVPIEQIQMQIGLYIEHFPASGLKGCANMPFLLFTAFDLSERDLELLKSCNIKWFRLGQGFETWYNEEKAKKSNAKPMLVL